MKVMSPGLSRVDRVLGGLIMMGSLFMALMVAAVNSGGQFSLGVLALAVPFGAPGFVAGLGVYWGQKWGYLIVIILGLFCLLPVPLAFLIDDGHPLQAVINGLPAIAVLCLCEFRLRGRLGPPLA